MYMRHEEYDCQGCLESELQTKDLKYWYKAILDQVFGLEEFNEGNLLTYLEEMAFVLEMKLPEGKLAIAPEAQEKTYDISKQLEAWKKFNNQYLFQQYTKTGA
jgi:hypothetical protein